MARSKAPGRLDDITAAALWAFADAGYDRTKIAHVAARAGVGPGTVYLYAKDKEALFELVLLRALESPVVSHPSLPYRKTDRAARSRLIDECLHEVAHFPQLWIGSQRRRYDGAREEYVGILLEMARWFRRYRAAILLAQRNRYDWPELFEAFDRVVWSDVQRRLTGYLTSRMRAGVLAVAGDPGLVARFAVDALVSGLVAGPVSGSTPERPGDDEVLVTLISSALLSPSAGQPLARPAASDATGSIQLLSDEID